VCWAGDYTLRRPNQIVPEHLPTMKFDHQGTFIMRDSRTLLTMKPMMGTAGRHLGETMARLKSRGRPPPVLPPWTVLIPCLGHLQGFKPRMQHQLDVRRILGHLERHHGPRAPHILPDLIDGVADQWHGSCTGARADASPRLRGHAVAPELRPGVVPPPLPASPARLWTAVFCTPPKASASGRRAPNRLVRCRAMRGG